MVAEQHLRTYKSCRCANVVRQLLIQTFESGKRVHRWNSQTKLYVAKNYVAKKTENKRYLAKALEPK